jgi:hypothetical protein
MHTFAGLVSRARIRLALLLLHAGAVLAQIELPEAADEPSPVEPVDPEMPVMSERALRMVRDGRGPQGRRTVDPPTPTLIGSARDRLEKAEAARRKAGR